MLNDNQDKIRKYIYKTKYSQSQSQKKVGTKIGDYLINMHEIAQQTAAKVKKLLSEEKNKKVYTLDIIGIMKKFIPNIFHFIELEPHAETIERKINKKLEERLLKPDENFDLFNDCSFYDLLSFTTRIGDKNDDQKTVKNMVYLLGCYDELFKSLNSKLSPEQKGSIKGTVLKVLHTTNSDYRHYIGELFVLDALLVSDFALNETAVPLGNGKDADFLITDKRNGDVFLFEVLNINLSVPDAKTVKKKLKWKINNKLKGDVDGSNFILQPVVWCKLFSDIAILAQNISEWDGYNFNEFNDRVIEPFSLFMLPTENGARRFEFTRISKMLTGFTAQNAL